MISSPGWQTSVYFLANLCWVCGVGETWWDMVGPNNETVVITSYLRCCWLGPHHSWYNFSGIYWLTDWASPELFSETNWDREIRRRQQSVQGGQKGYSVLTLTLYGQLKQWTTVEYNQPLLPPVRWSCDQWGRGDNKVSEVIMAADAGSFHC